MSRSDVALIPHYQTNLSMRIRLLGTAAGGGVPQWNCNCVICQLARAGTGRVRARTQSSVAISADGSHWFLLNASPDIRTQIEATSALHPSPGTTRGSRVKAVLLTNADLDHTLGLFLLREGEPLSVHATSQVQHALTEALTLTPTLHAFCGLRWVEPSKKLAPLMLPNGSPSGLLYQGIPLTGHPPRFARKGALPGTGYVIGYKFVDETSGGRLLFLPDVAEMDEGLLRWLPDCDVLLFDGTFWSENEMEQRGVGAASASAMGHVPISEPNGSLNALAKLTVKHKLYVHINNTNPILDEQSAERATVTKAGCLVGMDGMELEI